MAALKAALLLALASAGGGFPQDAPAADEAWRRAAEEPPGRARSRAVRHALTTLADTPEAPLEASRLQLAWEAGVEAARDLRLEEAIMIQTELERRHPADWSAMDLALSLGLAGRLEEADRVLARALERARAEGRPTAELWNRRGLLFLGEGRERIARDHLGRALAGGSADAAVVLARLALSRGEREAARAGLRPRLYDDPPGAWALRGWGLSLLPPLDPTTPPHPEEPSR